MMAHGDGGKGDTQRPTNHEAFSNGYDLIWGKKEKRLVDMTEADFNEALGIKPEEDKCQNENPLE
jgi:hypothetical protein